MKLNFESFQVILYQALILGILILGILGILGPT